MAFCVRWGMPSAHIDAVAESVRIAGSVGIGGPPIGNNVVVDLLLAGYLHQMNAAVTPRPKRFNPCARTPLVLGFEVSKVRKRPRPLNEAKTPQVLDDELADLEATGIRQGTPDDSPAPFATANPSLS